VSRDLEDRGGQQGTIGDHRAHIRGQFPQPVPEIRLPGMSGFEDLESEFRGPDRDR
jgi:hypothetical protein